MNSNKKDLEKYKKDNYLIEYKKEIDKGNIVVGQELYLELELHR